LKRMFNKYDNLLEEYMVRKNFMQPSVVITHPLAAGLLPLRWARRVTYYATDDWASAPEYQMYWPAINNAYEGIRSLRRNVVAVSGVILDAIKPTGGTLVLPNGIDSNEWTVPLKPPQWLIQFTRPIALYVATIDERLDQRAIREIAHAISPGSVILVGHVKDGSIQDALSGLSNVTFVGAMPRHEVPGIVGYADLCLLPHRVTQFTRAMSPLNIYEALAAGKPVVATDLPPVRDIDSHVVLVPEHGDYGEAMRSALARGSM